MLKVDSYLLFPPLNSNVLSLLFHAVPELEQFFSQNQAKGVRSLS